MASHLKNRADPQMVSIHHKSAPLTVRQEPVTAILVDGGFYRRRAASLFGHKEPSERADELLEYCKRHIRKS